jgi:hypothetical protein
MLWAENWNPKKRTNKKIKPLLGVSRKEGYGVLKFQMEMCTKDTGNTI